MNNPEKPKKEHSAFPAFTVIGGSLFIATKLFFTNGEYPAGHVYGADALIAATADATQHAEPDALRRATRVVHKHKQSPTEKVPVPQANPASIDAVADACKDAGCFPPDGPYLEPQY